MHYDYYEWYSNRVNRNLGVLRIGHWGPAMIYFPTCGGDHREFERYGMQEDAKRWIEEGKVQFFCLDGINMETWYNQTLHPADRVQEASGFEQYLIEEVVPLVQHVTQNPFIGCIGASFGGYNVTNMWLKHPDVFNLAVSLSGVFDIRDYLDGHYDDNAYYNNPVDYVPQLSDPWYFRWYNERSVLWMFCGEHDICRQGNDNFHGLLEAKGIRHWYDLWDAPADHNEFWWKKQLPTILTKFYNW